MPGHAAASAATTSAAAEPAPAAQPVGPAYEERQVLAGLWPLSQAASSRVDSPGRSSSATTLARAQQAEQRAFGGGRARDAAGAPSGLERTMSG